MRCPWRTFAWTEKIRKRSDPTRLPPRRRPVPACAGRDDVSSPVSPWHPPLWSSTQRQQASQKVIQHTLSADEALVYHFNEKDCLKNSSWVVDILPGVMCRYLPEFGTHGKHFLLRSRRTPLRGWMRRTPPEEVSSRVAHVVPTAKFDALFHSEKSVNHAEEGHSGSKTGNQLPS